MATYFKQKSYIEAEIKISSLWRQWREPFIYMYTSSVKKDELQQAAVLTTIG